MSSPFPSSPASVSSIALILIGLLLSGAADARSAAERKAFHHSNPCPSTGKTVGKCPGYVVDHIIPLCDGGADNPSNMQWQELAASKAKDKQEWRNCRELRRSQS